MSTLHIIGNGFDLHHKLPTTYHHFFEYAKNSGESTFLTQIDTYFGKSEYVNGHYENILWSQLEMALGIYNVDDIMRSLFEGHIFDIDHASSSIGEVEAEVECMFVPIRETFTRLFAEWVRSIDLTHTQVLHIPHLDRNGVFLTFNYTNTLEDIYGIPKSHILHIHGDARLKYSDFSVGHNNKFTSFKKYPDDFYDKNDYQNKIAGVINGLYKDTLSIIHTHSCFFNSLSNVDKVVVYGHSLGDVDKPYFEEVQQKVQTNAKWLVSIHEVDECTFKRNFFKNIGIQDCNIRTFLM